MLRTISKLFGVVLLIVGVLGFVPGITSDNHLLGVFHVNTVHNIIHLLSGAAALYAGLTSTLYSRRYFQVFGIIYALVTVLGFMTGDGDILGLVANNMADNLLHVAIAGSALYLGFAYRDNDSAPRVA